MTKSNILSAAAILLLVAGIYLVYLGNKAGIQPPIITGIGFLVIAFVFFLLRKPLT
jgi:hypothetical protein